MPSTSSGPLTLFLKEAGVIADTARQAGRGVAQIGRGIWGAAGRLAPHPAARAGILGVTAIGVGTQVPHLAGRVAQGAQFARGEAPLPPRGF